MAELKREREFGVSPDDLWKKIGDFTDMSWAGIAPDSLEALDGGKRRKISMGPSSVVEALVASDERSYSYTIEEGPLPVSNYRSTLSVEEAGDGSAKVRWVGTFDPAEGTPAEGAEQIIAMVYDGGLDALEKSLQ
jgi:hypothetical protein